MELEIIFQLILAILLGAFIGLERELKKKEAGLRTYVLVTLGTCLFTLITFALVDHYKGKAGVSLDPLRIIQAIAIGIGFIGGGVIFRQREGIAGLTTAAGLWATAAIGIAIGVKLYFLAIFSTFLTLLILSGLEFLEEKVLKTKE